MTEYKRHPSFYIRGWLQQELFNTDIIDQIDYGQVSPIIPMQDVEEVNQTLGKLPYIVYFSMPSPVPNQELFFIKEEHIYFNILSNNYTELAALTSFLIDMLDRKDISAREINESMNSEHVLIRSVSLESAKEPSPTAVPAGRYIQELCFSYSYTRQMDPDGRFAF